MVALIGYIERRKSRGWEHRERDRQRETERDRERERERERMREVLNIINMQNVEETTEKWARGMGNDVDGKSLRDGRCEIIPDDFTSQPVFLLARMR